MKKNKEKVQKEETSKKKTKVRVSRVIIFLLFLYILIYSIHYFFNINITNIFIFNNYHLSDQEIIEIAGLSDYPSAFGNLNRRIENRLESNIYIKEADVSKRWFRTVNIHIIENRPLFFYNHTNQTVLLDGTSVDTIFATPTVLNYIVDSIYDDFVRALGKVDIDVMNRISEIEYSPNNVDDSRFFLTMTDGNYVYINIRTFYKLDRYLDIIRNFPGRNGILYLDYGNNFEIIN